jgi:thioredoxin reductase (NADPH)
MVEEFRGNGQFTSVLARNQQTGVAEELRPAAVFIFIGQRPNSQIVKGLVELDPYDYIVTGHDVWHLLDDAIIAPPKGTRAPFDTETSVPGIFAAGDVRKGATAQIASAVGEGASAAPAIRDYLKGR